MTPAETYPTWLNRLDSADITFVLNLVEPVDLPPMAVLQLRREFVGVMEELERRQGKEVAQSVNRLLFPEPTTDPVMLRQVQKPGAAVVLSPDTNLQGTFSAGQQITLPALFIGDGVVCVKAFLLLLNLLGERGIHRGQGRFNIDSLILNNGSNNATRSAAEPETLAPAVIPLGWRLLQTAPLTKVNLKIISPMRLIKRGKPLFRLNFNDLFTSVLRRVGGLAAFHSGTEIDLDHHRLIALANEVEYCDYDLHWRDWRHLEQGRKSQGLGGLTGVMTLTGGSLPDLLWLFELGSLLHVGKGASYGFGRYRLVDVVDRPVKLS